MASYRILLLNWMIYSFLVANSFSGCILASMNVRIYDHGVDTVSKLGDALARKKITGGTLEKGAWLAMIEVSDARAEVKVELGLPAVSHHG